MKLVPFNGLDTCPESGIAFYVNSGRGGVIGVQVLSNGTKRQINATYACKHKDGTFHHDCQPRYQFRDAWGHHRMINVPRAVYTAWHNKPIPPGMTIDHIDGCATNNHFRNLRCVSGAINSRDGGFLRKLRHQGIDPKRIQRPLLLRYFDRMAKLKPAISDWRYRHLTRADLLAILESPVFIPESFISHA